MRRGVGRVGGAVGGRVGEVWDERRRGGSSSIPQVALSPGSFSHLGTVAVGLEASWLGPATGSGSGSSSQASQESGIGYMTAAEAAAPGTGVLGRTL